jgi:GNAT superfamily N-acetyltransferase
MRAMKSTGIQIRPATAEDLSILSGFAAELMRKWDSRATERDAFQVYECILNDPKLGVILLAEQNGAICGFVYACTILRTEFAGETLDLVEMFVEQSLRNKGVGRSLLDGLIAYARKRNITRLTCQVHRNNAAIERVLESAGFDPERRTLWGVRL